MKTATNTTATALNRDQLRYLQQRLDALRQEFRYSTAGNLAARPLPSRLVAARRAVRAADTAIRRFNKSDGKRRERLNKQIDKAMNDARVAILFRPPVAAFKVVTGCERKIKRIVYGKVARGA